MEDSWLTNGDCTKCRRQSYCSTECKAHKSFTSNTIKGMALRMVMEGYKKVYKREDKK